jgi:ankyrin repeat protein
MMILISWGETLYGIQSLQEQFLEAATLGDVESVAHFLSKGVDINSRDRQQETALHRAVLNSQRAMVAFLLRQPGIDSNPLNKNHVTPFFRACSQKSPAIAILLLENGADSSLPDKQKRTPLHCCALMGNLQIARLLIQKGACVNVLDHTGHTPLYWAAATGKRPLIRQLIRFGSKVDRRSSSFEKSKIISALASPTLYAIVTHQTLLAERLIAEHNISHPREIIQDREKLSAVVYAASHGESKIVSKLLSIEKYAYDTTSLGMALTIVSHAIKSRESEPNACRSYQQIAALLRKELCLTSNILIYFLSKPLPRAGGIQLPPEMVHHVVQYLVPSAIMQN